jgi:hypothetical protein
MQVGQMREMIAQKFKGFASEQEKLGEVLRAVANEEGADKADGKKVA